MESTLVFEEGHGHAQRLKSGDIEIHPQRFVRAFRTGVLRESLDVFVISKSDAEKLARFILGDEIEKLEAELALMHGKLQEILDIA